MMKNVHIWLGEYWKQGRRRRENNSGKKPVHVMFCFADHFEPDWNGADMERQAQRIRAWTDRYPALAARHRDADGRVPKHTFFYPIEGYVWEQVGELARLCREGFGEVEIHLHHQDDTEEGLKSKINKAKSDFRRHGLLGHDKKTGEVRYGFIHGNWALNNSRSDGKWCGVNGETRILKETGCYADFTLPSAPSETQTRQINSIYYDQGNGTHPKSHNTGPDVKVLDRVYESSTAATGSDRSVPDPGLMLIQGPLALNWRRRKLGILPRIENGDVTAANPPTPDRVDLWVRQGIAVKGRPEWVFIKVHTHGAAEKNAEALLGQPMEDLFTCLEKHYNDGKNYVLHYVTAREMYNIIKAAEAGEAGNPGQYRDYLIEL